MLYAHDYAENNAVGRCDHQPFNISRSIIAATVEQAMQYSHMQCSARDAWLTTGARYMSSTSRTPGRMHFDSMVLNVKDTSPALKLGLGCLYNRTARVYDPSIHAHINVRTVVNDTSPPLLHARLLQEPVAQAICTCYGRDKLTPHTISCVTI